MSDAAVHDELQQYIDNEAKVKKSASDFDLIDFWVAKWARWPKLACVALILHGLASTSSNSERTFSACGLLITALRTQLAPATVKMMIFIKRNLKLIETTSERRYQQVNGGEKVAHEVHIDYELLCDVYIQMFGKKTKKRKSPLPPASTSKKTPAPKGPHKVAPMMENPFSGRMPSQSSQASSSQASSSQSSRDHPTPMPFTLDEEREDDASLDVNEDDFEEPDSDTEDARIESAMAQSAMAAVEVLLQMTDSQLADEQTAASAAAFVANALSFPDDYDKDDGAAAGNEEDAVVDAAVSAVRAEMQRLERES